MSKFNSLDDLLSLRETVEVEAKSALGQNGRGKLPQDFWPTYSAFANTRGGVVVLGLKEHDDRFELVGILDHEKILTDLFNQLNNPQRVSINLLSDDSVKLLEEDGRAYLVIDIPRAPRRNQPVYIGGNPMTGTYRRLHEGDRLCDADTVRRMLAEQTQDTRDLKVLRNYDLADLDLETVRVYRQAIADARGTHPFLDSSGIEFLRLLGAWRRDRETAEEGLTVAGLLMFGRAESIREEFPYYMLDYQERAQASAQASWSDRITIDGTWSGNIYDFYRRVYRKLVSDLRVPFEIREGRRQDETPVHKALREAIVNTVVHADYTGRASILVVKRPDMFGFRNPGLMRISIPQAVQGGESDGRNRTLQQMFLLVGAGERAGSGVPRIYQGWAGQHWRPPILREREEPSDQTLLELRMVDLLPAESVAKLQDLFGDRLNHLDYDQRLMLATAATEGEVTNSRMQTICGLHRADITRNFQGLVKDGFLVQSGRTSGTTYHLPGEDPFQSGASFIVADPPTAPKGLVADNDATPARQRGNLGPNEATSGAEWGNLVANEVTSPPGDLTDDGTDPILIIDKFEELPAELRERLAVIAKPMAEKGRLPLSEARNVIIRLCDGNFISIKAISLLLNRGEQHLRDRLILPMVADGLLIRAYPLAANHPRQAYKSSKS